MKIVLRHSTFDGVLLSEDEFDDWGTGMTEFLQKQSTEPGLWSLSQTPNAGVGRNAAIRINLQWASTEAGKH